MTDSWSPHTRLFRKGMQNDPSLPDRFEDRDGRAWDLVNESLTIAEARALFDDPSVATVVVQNVWPTFWWLDPPRRERDWLHVADRMLDGVARESSADGSVQAEEWRRGRDRLLLLEDHEDYHRQ